MHKKIICLYFLFAMLIFSACANDKVLLSQEGETAPITQPEQTDTHAKILKVYTDLQQKSGWWTVPRDVTKMTVFVEAKNTDTVLFWVVPTGTETWGERMLIGYDKDWSDGWSLKWEFGNRTLHDHIYVQALGSDNSTLDGETINVTTE